jgi:ketosteroid isomerase-like protein
VSKIPNPGGSQKPENDHRLVPHQEAPQQEDHPEEANQQEDGQEETQDPRHYAENDQLEASGVDDFFQRLPGSFRWPKPNAEAIAAAVEAVHRMSGNTNAQHLATAGATDHSANACSGCGGGLPPGARFCLACGVPTQAAAGDPVAPPQPASGQHHYHHHYHHFVPGAVASALAASAAPAAESGASTPRGRAPGASGTTTPGGRAEAGARQVVQDWAQACNTRHIDDLLELYAADATIIRSSVPPVRSLPAIREFLISLLEAGLGDVEMESLRLEIMGEIALDLGRCKMLVPVAMGKRREERGKYLVVLVRQPTGTWKIFADCWSSDLAISPAPEPAPRKPSEPPQPLRKPR